MVANLDLCIAGQSAIFNFPEVKSGITIAAGGLPRFLKLSGIRKACTRVRLICQSYFDLALSTRV